MIKTSLLILIISILLQVGFAAGEKVDMEKAFNEREVFKDKTQLGDPNDMADFTQNKGNTNDLQQLDDNSLINRGRSELSSSDQGSSLQDAEEVSREAIDQHQINSDNPWLKKSMEIEADPLSAIDPKQKAPTVKEKVTIVPVIKTCIEGVDFNIDLARELIVNAREEEYLGPAKQEVLPFNGPNLVMKSRWIFSEEKIKKGSFWRHSKHQLNVNSSNAAVRVYAQKEIAARKQATADQIIMENFYAQNIGGSVTGWGLQKRTFLFPTYNFTYQFKEKQKRFVINSEYWQISTTKEQELAQSNHCYEVSRHCIKSGSKTFFGKYEVSRPCWYENIKYRCRSEPRDGCAHLIKQGCREENSVCEYRIGSLCLRWKREYLCNYQKKEEEYSVSDSEIYCLGGDCHTPVRKQNTDFANVGYLAATNEAQKDCEKGSNGLCKNPITVFPGSEERCKFTVANCINCCSSMKGWGKDLLANCSGGEKGLAMKRDRGLCKVLGTYCALRAPLLGVCLEHKTSFCCFNSKLARIFHEQGRNQLNIDWGTPERPNCRPFTMEELGRIDFSKFDMEELFSDMLEKGKGNANKQIKLPKEGEVPEIQKHHRNSNIQTEKSL